MSDRHLLQCTSSVASSSAQSPSSSTPIPGLSGHENLPTPPVYIDHSHQVARDIGHLFDNADFSDLVLIVEEQSFSVHRIVLAARSEYFRALLYGGMKESNRSEIVLQDISATAFTYILRYVYTGALDLTNMKEDTVLDVLGLAHQYNFAHLELGISRHLHQILTLANCSQILNVGVLFHLDSLVHSCLHFLDANAESVLDTAYFAQFSVNAIEQLISRDSFFAPEIQIFRAVLAWCQLPGNSVHSERLVCHIRLPLIDLKHLLSEVRTSEIVSPNTILDAIDMTQKCDGELRYRGVLIPEMNLASSTYNASVTHGECTQELLDGDTRSYDIDRGFARHSIKPPGKIVVHLGRPSIINTIKMLLWDKDMRSYSYLIEVSMNEKDWVRVIDHRAYLCRSWQVLHFNDRVVQYIRVVGTHNTVNAVFHAVAFECYYTNAQFRIYKGLQVPLENVATIARSACVVEGVSRVRNTLINGDTKNYDWDSGYTCHQLGSGAIVVQLAQPYYISSVRFKLWDLDDRCYSYTVEVSTDQSNWQLVCDRSSEPCRSWQLLHFHPRPVTFVRIVGTRNSVNEVFHVVHFEAPYDTENLLTQCLALESTSPDNISVDDNCSVTSSTKSEKGRGISPTSSLH